MTKPKSTYLRGVQDGAPFLLVVIPFALLFGVLATEAGLTTPQTMAFTSVVFAGAAQFAALQLMTENAPVLIILATALAVNLRMAMYSASLAPWLGAAPLWQRALIGYLNVDQSFALASIRFEDHSDWTIPERFRFILGVMTPIGPFWVAATGLGIWLGAAIPDWMALDFAVPICFLALIGPALRTLAHLAAALTSVALALLLAFIPYNFGLLIAALIAMMVGAQVELWLERKAAS